MTAFVPSVTESQALTSLATFLASVLPAATKVVRGQVNRVPQPANVDQIVMWPILRARLETNGQTFQDVAFTASIAAGGTMTVSALQLGVISVGQVLLGSGLALGTLTSITGQVSGSVGGTGVYTVSGTAGLPSQQLAAGSNAILQPIKLTVQLDVHGPTSGQNAQLISTLLRDPYAIEAFASYGVDVTPLYAEDPRQVPFTNAEGQLEERWTVDVCLQLNPIVVVPQAAAAQLSIKSYQLVPSSVYPAH